MKNPASSVRAVQVSLSSIGPCAPSRAAGLRSRIVDLASKGVFRAAVRVGHHPGLEHVGSAYGGWTVPLSEIDSSWVCYTVGIGEDSSFDVALAERGCQVVAIDPTPRAVAHIRPFLNRHPNMQLAPHALWTEDTELSFYPPADSSHVSYSLTNRQRTESPITVSARTLESIAGEMGHERIDLLKLDIEGAEYEVIGELDLARWQTRVVCVEFHTDGGPRPMLEGVRRIIKQGYRAVARIGTDVTLRRITDLDSPRRG